MKFLIFLMTMLIASPLTLVCQNNARSRLANMGKLQNAPALQAELGLGSMTNMACSDSLNRIAVSSTEGMWLYQAQSLELPPTQVGSFSADIEEIVFDAARNKLMAYGYDYGTQTPVVRLWSLDDNSEIDLAANSDVRPRIIFDGQGDPLVATFSAADRTITIINVLTSEGMSLTLLDDSQFNNWTFNSDGTKLAFSTAQAGVNIWDLATDKVSLITQQDGVNQLKFSPDGSRLALGNWTDSLLQIWNVENTQKASLVYSESLLGDVVTGLEFGENGKQLIYTRWGDGLGGEAPYTLNAVDLRSEALIYSDAIDIYSLENTEFAFAYITTCPTLDGYIIGWDTGSGVNQVRLWEASQNHAEMLPLGLIFPRHSTKIIASAFSSDGQLFMTISEDHIIRKWDIFSSNQPFAAMVEGSFYIASFSANGTRLAIGDFGGTIQIFDVSSLQKLLVIDKHSGNISSLSFSSNGEILAIGDYNGDASVWNIETKGEIFSFSPNQKTFIKAKLSPNGQYLALNSPYFLIGVIVWNLEQGRILVADTHDLRGSAAMVFSENNAVLVASFHEDITQTGSGLLKIWHIEDSEAEAQILPQDGEEFAEALLLNEDGTVLTTKDWSGGVKILVVGSEEDPISFQAQIGDQLVLSPDGTWLATGGEGGIIELWSVK